jgi:hypothetical protein
MTAPRDRTDEAARKRKRTDPPVSGNREEPADDGAVVDHAELVKAAEPAPAPPGPLSHTSDAERKT